MLKLQEVYKINGFPEHTFVRPKEYTQLYVALDTPGRNIIIEGPSGIGKTSSITQAIKESGQTLEPEILSARKMNDISRISAVADGDFSLTIIDDFHRLDKSIKTKLANLIKTMADDEVENKKLILIGISDAGRTLIELADDIVNRVEVISFEVNSDKKIEELISLGEDKLNISINTKSDIIHAANGSFFLAQLLCYHCCIEAEQITAYPGPEKKIIEISFESVKYKVFTQLSKKFNERTVQFSQGGKLRQEGRAPYLNILYHLSKSTEWILDLRQLIRQDTLLKGSISQVVSKGFLKDIYDKSKAIQEVIFYDVDSKKLTVQDPQYIYYLRNIKWHSFAREVGFTTLSFPTKYDFALSFSGEDRNIAENIFTNLTGRDVAVFYDKNEQHRIVASDVEDYLGPIYNSESEFIIVLLSSSYPRRIWTKFESDAFDHRIGKTVIPVLIDGFNQNFTDKMTDIGHFSISSDGDDLSYQINSICECLCQRLIEHREQECTEKS